MIRNKQFPYLQCASDLAINSVINKIKEKISHLGISGQGYFMDKIDCFCWISQFE